MGYFKTQSQASASFITSPIKPTFKRVPSTKMAS